MAMLIGAVHTGILRPLLTLTDILQWAWPRPVACGLRCADQGNQVSDTPGLALQVPEGISLWRGTVQSHDRDRVAIQRVNPPPFPQG
jgi:hypothetical protein